MEPITLRYQVQPEELADVLSRQGAKGRWVQLALGAFLTASAGVALWHQQDLLAGTMWGLGGLWLGGALFLGGRSRYLKVVRLMPSVLEPITLRADASGMHTVSVSSNEWCAWRTYDSVADDHLGVHFRTKGTISGRWIPARAFTHPAQQAAWCEQVRGWMAAEPAPPPVTSALDSRLQ